MSIYSKEFKEEAIRLSDDIGSKKAAARLGIPYYTPADRRNRSKHESKETATMSEEELRNRNREFEKDNAELREANNIGRTRFFRKRPEEVKTCERHVP